MADLQITGLNRLVEADINQADELAVADVSATETKKVTVKDLVNAVVTATGTSFLADGAIPGSKVGTLGTNLVDTATIVDNKVTNVKIETSTSATTGIDGSQKLRDGSVPVVKLDASKFDRGLSVVASKLGIGNSITAGTKNGITYTAQGLISGVADLVATDLPIGTASAIGAVKVESGSLLEVSNTGAIDVKNVSGLSAGTYASVTVNAKGQVTAGSTSATATTIPAATTSVKGGVIVPTSGGMAVDVSGNLSIATQGSVSAGDYAKVTVNTKGIVTGTGTLAAADIPDHSAAKLTSGTIPADRIGSSAITATRIDTAAVTNDKVETSTNSSTGLDGSTKLRDGTITAAKLNTSNIDRSLNVAGGNLGINNAVTGGAATRSGITYNVQGLITGTAALGASDLPIATSSAVGGISVGTGLSVNGSGVLSLSNSVTGATVSGITFSSSGQITAATGLVAGDLPTATTSAKGAVQITSNGGLTVDGSGNLSTSTSGVSAGTYQSVTVSTKGVVTAGAALTAALIPNLAASKITSGSLDAARIANDSITGAKLSNSSTAVFQSISQSGYPTADFSGQILFDTVSEDAFIWDGNAWQAITTLTKGSLVFGGTYNANSSQMVATTSAGIAAGLSVGSNLPTPSATTDGVYVVVSSSGTPASPAPAIAFAPPDYILGVTNSAGSSWNEVDLSQTVAGQVASNITFTPYGQISSTNVQDAIQELETEKMGLAGGTLTGQLLVGNTGSLVFEGSSIDAYETTIGVTNPTSSDKTILFPDISGNVITSGDTNTVTSTMVDGSLVNTNLAAGAAIAFSKLAALTSAQILVGNGSNVPTAVAVTGDISINNAGLTSIAAGAIVNADISGSAAIAGSKIVAGTTSVVGVVQLVDSTTSTSTTLAATGASVKAAKDAADAAATTAGAAVAKSGSTMTGNLIIDNAKELRLSEADSDGAHFTGFKAQAQSADITYTLPATAPTTGQVLKSSSTATTLEWATDSANAGGSNTQVQFNNSGAFAGSASLTFNSGTGALTATSFVGNVTGDLSGTASSLTVTANNATDETVYLLFADGATGSQGAESDTGLTYNPSTGLLTSTGFSGSGASLTSLNASNLGSGTVATARLGTGTASSSNYLRGDGTWQAVPSGTTINNNANNRVITGSGTANTLEGEATFTYNGTDTLEIQPASATPAIFIGDSNRTGAGQGLVQYKGNWNGTTVARITMDSGADTTNKDDGIIRFDTAPSGSLIEAARIDSAGRLLVGLTDGSQSTQDGNLQIKQSACIRRHVASAGAGTLRFEKTRAATDTNTVVQNGDNLGEIFWYGADGNSYELAAGISASVDATPGDGDMPGRLSFGTTPDGSAGLTTRMVITNSGNIGIGTTSPSQALTCLSGTANSAVSVFSGNDANRGLKISTAAANSQDNMLAVLEAQGQHSGSYLGELSFKTNNSEAMRLDSSGRLLVGTSTARTDFYSGALDADIQLEGSNYAAYSVYATNGNGAFIFGAGGRTDGSTVGNISWMADDGTDEVEAARIQCQIDGTPGSNDMPGRLVFHTTADGAASPTERMRIDKSGHVQVSTGQFTVGTTATTGLQFISDGTFGTIHSSELKLRTASGERFRIGTSGQLGIGGATYGTSGQVLTSGGASAAPTWADAGGASEITANASGAVTAGKTMIINTNGTTSHVSSSTAIRNPPVWGTNTDSSLVSDNQKDQRLCYDKDNNVLLWVYRTNSNDTKARAGTPGTNTITWGNETTIASSAEGNDVAYVGSGKFIVIYRERTGSNYYKGVMLSISNNAITVGTANAVANGQDGGDKPACVYHPEQNRLYVIYPRYGNRLTVSAGLVDTSSPNSWQSDWRGKTVGGSGSDANGVLLYGPIGGSNKNTRLAIGGNSTCTGRSAVYDPDAERVICIFENTSDTSIMVVSCDVMSSTGVNTAQSVNNTSPDQYSNLTVAYDTTTNRAVGMYQISSAIYARSLTWGGSSFTFGTEITVYNNQSNKAEVQSVDGGCVAFVYGQTTIDDLSCITGTLNTTNGDISLSSQGVLSTDINSGNGSPVATVYNPNQDKIHVHYRQGDSGPRYMDTVSLTETTTNAERYVGIANNSASDGQSVTIRTFGSTNSNQSSLTTGSVYYIQKDGTLSTTADTPSVVAGVALSATSILVKS